MNEILKFMFNALIRAFAVGGYSFFGLIVATHDFRLCLSASAIAAGSYFFTELIRYFKINERDVLNKINKKGRFKFRFILFP